MMIVSEQEKLVVMIFLTACITAATVSVYLIMVKRTKLCINVAIILAFIFVIDHRVLTILFYRFIISFCYL